MKRGRNIPDFAPSTLGVGRDQRRQVVFPTRQQNACPGPMMVVDN
jgi:hypothetical protein